MLHTTFLLPTSIGALLLAAVHAAPAKRFQGPRLSCDWDNALPAAKLSAGDVHYGSGGPDLGYKSFTEDGKEILRVVALDSNDNTIAPLDSVIRVSCNSTALNYYSHEHQFGSDNPVKLRSGIGRDGVPYCLGIQHPTADPTDIVLVPCSEYDDESQANQFWRLRFKYLSLLPLVGKSNTSASVDNNAWPILKPADGANPQTYRAVQTAEEEDSQSFILQ